MTAMNHFSTTKATSLSSAMTSVATAVYVVDGSTYPDPAVPSNGQYSIIIGYGSDREEICTVIAKPGTNQLTVTRGQDGTAAVSKNIGDVVVHGVSARDFNAMATTTYVDAAVAAAVPAGLIAPYGSATPPTGWLLCNGQATTGYPILTAMYGATVPDLRDKFVMGDGGALPNTGGAATVALSTANMPSHSHGGTTASGNAAHSHGGSTTSAGSHNHTLPGWAPQSNQADAWYGNYGLVTSNVLYDPTTTGTDGSHAHTINSDNASHAHSITAEGSGTAHENLPPYYALTFMVRAG
jgi:microcystin-dependent protein